jgi:hypothetical protein
VLQKERAMKKSLCLCVFLLFFHFLCSAGHADKKNYINCYKPSKHYKKSQSCDQSVQSSSMHKDTKKMLEDLYHRYPRKYARAQPKRIEQDDFQ